jgi:hypothetical protein|tara:strand:- start:2326 stop:2604 length:279 start_codon:yes stop_codon:yes gene_type:complete
MKNHNPFRYFETLPGIIRLAVMMYVRYPLSLRNVEDLLHEWGVEICHETVKYWWSRFGPLFANVMPLLPNGGKFVRHNRDTIAPSKDWFAFI